MHVLLRPHLPRTIGVLMAAVAAIVITVVLVIALRSVDASSDNVGTPAVLVAPRQAPNPGTAIARGPLAPLLSASPSLRWGTSIAPTSVRG